MKAEINNENKAKFFALYWEQEILEATLNGGGFKIYKVIPSELYPHYFQYTCHLLLKPLSSISDEDCLDFAKWAGVDEEAFYKNLDKSKPLFIKEILHEDLPFHAADYLRLKGYALPWMGLSVEEMVEAGWIKLIEK